MKTLFDSNLTLEDAKELIENGADVNEQNNVGFTPLFYVVNVDIATLFINCNVNVNATDKNGCTPLFYVNDIDVAKLLIKYGANVNHQNKYKATPIFNYKRENIFLLLIDNGADINLRTSVHKTESLLDSIVLSSESNQNHIKFLITRGGIFGKINNYQLFRELFTQEQQKAFDVFASITNNDDDFFAMCLSYQNDQKNHVKMDIKDMDII